MFNEINSDYIKETKAGNKKAVATIKLLKGAILLKEKENKKELTDEEIISIVEKQIKMRKDAIIEFEKASRNDLIDEYNEEIKVLSKYMPEALSEEEIEKIINDAFEVIKPESMKDFGNIMKEVTPKLKGRADMKEVSNLIKNKLNS